MESQHEELALLRATTEQAVGALLVLDPQTGSYVYANPAASRLLGLPAQEFLGRGPSRLRSLCGWEPPVAQALIGCHPEAVTETFELRREDCDAVQVEASSRAIRCNGRWLIAVNMRDVTEQRAERARMQLFRAALDEVSDALCLVDPATMQFIDFNDAACSQRGLSRGDLMKLGPAAAMGMPAAELQGKYHELMAGHPRIVVEEQFLERPDGTGRLLECTRRATNVDGRWLVIAVSRDVTERKRSQSRIELLASAVNLSSDIILLIDRAGMRLVDANEAACRFYGASREELLARRPWELNRVNTDRNSLETLFDDVVAASPRQLLDTGIVQKAGIQRAVEIQRQAIMLEQRWIIVVTVRDITEGKRSQARLERFASALDLSADSLFLVDRETLTYLDFNESACRLLGLSRAELLTRKPNVSSPTLGTLQDIGALYDRVISQAPSVMADELVVHRADGTQVACEVHRQALLSEGRWVILANLRDISERKRQQAHFERFASVVNMSADAVFLIERESMRILDVNEAACRLYRYQRPELLDLPLRRTMRQGPSEEEADGLEQQYDKLIAISPQITVSDRVQVRSDGTSFPAESQRQAILSDGKWIIVVTVRDVTERQRTEQELGKRVSELTRSNQELAQYAYVISHDLSEPLRAVASYTQLLERRYAPQLDDDAREFMGYIVSGAHRMKRLIDDLLTYSQAGRSDVPIRPAPLRVVLNDALANLAHAIDLAGATVDCGDLPDIICDKSIAQVLQNLIGNALKFRGEAEPHIRIEGAEEADTWVVSVQDNGIGIEPEYFKRIFDLFQRLHPRTKYAGTGIGLSICKKIVERHGGWVGVESTPGQGTRFSVRLPKSPGTVGG